MYIVTRMKVVKGNLVLEVKSKQIPEGYEKRQVKSRVKKGSRSIRFGRKSNTVCLIPSRTSATTSKK
jgi:hypothetical protein